ncbi:hypothetical protein [Streptomyces xinghaiensis]|uniref:hypothetical protein n=1 Tax=Streptomyces xinghaiensis TaxID=1038928 RepID=UPI002E139769|nr:hypothetical protein OG463_24615 [Streptomyces xinghaiensis]
MIKPEAIPQFTGDLEQLEKDATGLGNDADDIRETGKGVHTQFQGLSAFYTAPEAEALFASTKPVQDRADEFADDLEKVKSALDEYASEVRPLVAKLKQLKADAAAFVASVEDDDEWKYDGDKIDEHNALQSDVTATVAAFWEAERTAANKITALVGGTQYRANDGSDGKNMYGFSADDMKDAEVPWGTAENEKYHWYEVHQHIKSFVWDGLIVDGVWGTIKGLGTLVGFDGWEAMKDAWKGLGMLVVGTALYTSPLAYAIPDSALPQWMKDSKEVAKQTGKALLAWDTWSENPARAAGAVTFNVLTSITGAGNIAKGGTVAKVASVAGKAGKFLDPMTHISSVVGKAGQAMKIGDVLAGLKNLNLGKIDIPAIPDGATLLPDGRLELPDGTVKVPDTPLQLADGTVHVPEGTAPRVPSELPSGAVLMPDGSVLHPDGRLQLPDGSTSTVDVPVEPHKADLANPDRAAVRVPEQELVGAGARSNPPGAVAQVGDAGNPSAVADNTVGGGNPAQVGANAGDTALGATARTGDNLPGGTANPGGYGPGGPVGPGGFGDNLPGATGRVGDAPGGGTPGGPYDGPSMSLGDNAAGATDTLPPGGRDLPEGPGAGPHPGDTNLPDGNPGSGPADAIPPGTAVPDNATTPGGGTPGDGTPPRTPEEVMRNHVDRVNDPNDTFFDDHYKVNGHRRDVERLVDGQPVPKLRWDTSDPMNPKWIAADDAPPPVPPNYLESPVHGKAETVSPDNIETLDRTALHRQDAIAADRAAETTLADARQAYESNPSEATKDAYDAADAAHKPRHDTMGKAGETLGDQAAEFHAIPENFSDAQRVDNRALGNNRFDQIWERSDGSYVVVEAKGPSAQLGDRRGLSGRQVMQGTREYFESILAQMDKRGVNDQVEGALAEKLDAALKAGKVEYVVVRAKADGGQYAGYTMKKFDIR